MDYSLFPATPVLLERPSFEQSWGFRLQGGIDYRLPLSIKKVRSLVVFSVSTGLASRSHPIQYRTINCTQAMGSPRSMAATPVR